MSGTLSEITIPDTGPWEARIQVGKCLKKINWNLHAGLESHAEAQKLSSKGTTDTKLLIAKSLDPECPHPIFRASVMMALSEWETQKFREALPTLSGDGFIHIINDWMLSFKAPYKDNTEDSKIVQNAVHKRTVGSINTAFQTFYQATAPHHMTWTAQTDPKTSGQRLAQLNDSVTRVIAHCEELTRTLRGQKSELDALNKIQASLQSVPTVS